MKTAHTAAGVWVALLLLAGPVPAQQDSTAPTPTAQQTAGEPVILRSDTVLLVRSRVGSFTAAERAAAIQRRLEQLSSDPYFRADSLRLNPGDASIDIVVGDRVLMTITDADAAAAGLTREATAAAYFTAIQQALQRESLTARFRTLGLGVLFTLLAIIAVFIIFRVAGRIHARAAKTIEAGSTTWVPTIRIQKQVLLSAAQTTAALLWLARALHIVLLALLLYVTLPIILSFFPWTRPYADRLFGYVITPFVQIWNAFTQYVPNLFTIAAIAVFTYFLLKVIRMVFDGIGRGNVALPGFFPEWAEPTYKLVRTMVFIFALIMVWPYLPGSGSPAFQGVGVMVGLLISLGSASAVSNLIGGIVLTYMRSFKVGDRVRIADTVGDVVERSLLATRVRTIKNVDITIPNAMVLSNHIINYSSIATETGVILHTTVTIGYDAPWRQVHELLTAAALATDGILEEPPPFVLQTSLDDFYVSYEINAYTDTPGRMAVIYSQLHQNIQDRFNEGGVEIMSPHYRAQRDGNTTTIPASYLPGDYRAPAFRVESLKDAVRADNRISADTDGAR